jgi:hypothetical protein
VLETSDGSVLSLYCIALYCIVLYCIVLYCIVLYCAGWHGGAVGCCQQLHVWCFVYEAEVLLRQQRCLGVHDVHVRLPCCAGGKLLVLYGGMSRAPNSTHDAVAREVAVLNMETMTWDKPGVCVCLGCPNAA